jgi:hypothetical protein
MRQFMRFFSHPRYPIILFAVALLLVSPSLFVGLQFDDYLQRTIILKSSNSLSEVLRTLFIFMDGNPVHTQAEMESGTFPWYALPQGKVAFWRPLSAFTHWLDYQLWPTSPLLMHVQSLMWYACLIWVVIILYRQFFDQTYLVYLAATLYLLDDARGFAVGWLSNRNALIAAVFGFTALIFHIRWRRNSWRPGQFLSPLFFALALLSGESALAVLGYLIAFAIFLDPTPRSLRFLSLFPYLIILFLWRVAYSAQGFGAWGTSYIDPTRESLRFLQVVIERVPILLLGQWAFPPAELYPLLTTPASVIYWFAAIIASSFILWLCWPLRSSPLARFFVLGSLLASIPSSASLPANRLLFFIGIGAFGMLALLVDSVLHNKRARIVRSLLFFHLTLSPLFLPLTAFSPAIYGNIEPSLASLPVDPAFAKQTAIFVNAPSHFYIGYLPDIRALTSLPEPGRLRFLASGLTPVTYTRADSRTLIVQPEGGYLSGFDAVFRDSAYPLILGQTITLTDMQIEIVKLTSDQRPAVVAFHFNLSPEDPSFRWFQWSRGRYIPFELPAIHEAITLLPSFDHLK